MPISSAQPTSNKQTHTHNCSQNYANGMKCKWATTTNRSKTEEEGAREYLYMLATVMQICACTNTFTIVLIRPNSLFKQKTGSLVRVCVCAACVYG